MHLAIEAVGAKHSGAAVVLQDVVSAALRNPLIEQLSVFCSPAAVRLFRFPSSPKLQEIECAKAEANTFSRIRWLTRGANLAVNGIRADALLCMHGIGTAGAIPTAIFIQQSLPFSPEALSRSDFITRLRMTLIGPLMKRSCLRAGMVITQTPTMRDWVRRDFGIDESKITVTKPWGQTPGMEGPPSGSVEPMLQTPADRRILHVGNSSHYKNVECLAIATGLIRKQFPGTQLFLTCPPGDPLCRFEGVTGLGFLGGKILRRAFDEATVFSTASLVESGNLTLIEAMVAGTPIVAADRRYAYDLCGDAALYFDPLNPGDAAAVIARLLNNPRERAKLARNGTLVAARERAERPYDKLISDLIELRGQSSTL